VRLLDLSAGLSCWVGWRISRCAPVDPDATVGALPRTMEDAGPLDADYFSAADESDNARGKPAHATGDAGADHSAAASGAAS
jgi:hypothetical protein